MVGAWGFVGYHSFLLGILEIKIIKIIWEIKGADRSREGQKKGVVRRSMLSILCVHTWEG